VESPFNIFLYTLSFSTKSHNLCYIIYELEKILLNKATIGYYTLSRQDLYVCDDGICRNVDKSLAFPISPINNTFITSKFIVLHMSDLNVITVASLFNV
jgi:hypothetical protein